jgi:hypothetical protein
VGRQISNRRGIANANADVDADARDLCCFSLSLSLFPSTLFFPLSFVSSQMNQGIILLTTVMDFFFFYLFLIPAVPFFSFLF